MSQLELLEPLFTVTIPATTAPFFVKDKFRVNTDANAPVKISSIDNNFRQWFGGKVEEPMAEHTLNCAMLHRLAYDIPLKEGDQAIIPELGGEARAETTLTGLYSLMKEENDESDVILYHGHAPACIFYIRDFAGVLRMVYVYRDNSWEIRAYPVGGPDRRGGGRYVFSRNSALVSSAAAPAPC